MAGSGWSSTVEPLSVQDTLFLARSNTMSVLTAAPSRPPVSVLLGTATTNHCGKPDSAGT